MSPDEMPSCSTRVSTPLDVLDPLTSDILESAGGRADAGAAGAVTALDESLLARMRSLALTLEGDAEGVAGFDESLLARIRSLALTLEGAGAGAEDAGDAEGVAGFDESLLARMRSLALTLEGAGAGAEDAGDAEGVGGFDESLLARMRSLALTGAPLVDLLAVKELMFALVAELIYAACLLPFIFRFFAFWFVDVLEISKKYRIQWFEFLGFFIF